MFRDFLYKQPSRKTKIYNELSKKGIVDPIAVYLEKNPMKTVGWRDVAGSDEALRSHPIYEYAKEFGEEHIMATAIPHETADFFSVISAYRKDRDKPFTDEEKKLKEIIAPHLVESYHRCLKESTYSKLIALEYKNVAIMNVEGRIIIDDNGQFVSLLNALCDKPIENNVIRDEVILDKIIKEHDDFFKNTFLKSQKLPNELFVVVLRQTPDMKILTPEEIKTVFLHKQGNSYQEIAKIMSISKEGISSRLRSARIKTETDKTPKINI